ncbi:NADH-quinone oxidoreductase subunit L, partial [Candidatus Sumerlaeota bacterium]|nr:NADH-quinone oxidoreductase subunit L [Candidatus Sumerlaeota bacterium]
MEFTLKLSILIFLLPLASFTILALFHKILPRHGDWIGIGALGAGLVCSLMIFFRAAFGSEPLFIHWTFDWLPTTAKTTIQGGMLIDGLTAVMLVVVTLVSFLVHLFSSKYMEGDVRYGRYYAALSLFTTSMLGIVFADNILYLFVFWELVGLSSYVLIGHWYEKKSASDAAIKAFITTRVGDVGMLIGMLIIYWKVGSLQYVDVFSASGHGGLMNDEIMLPLIGIRASWQTLAALGLFFGAMGKSAQFPLHVWLPDAMEGPTPVSALIHAATMVAAGVYLVGRLYPIFTPQAFLCVAYIGGITAIFAATIATVQDDIKKVLAYSTLSQLGYMMMSLGVGGFVVGGYYAGLFHLTTHAFFKAGLFLGSGSVIHAMHHEQSLSKYGGLAKKLPITNLTYLACVLAIIGCPPFAGFWSKDAILAAALQFSMDDPAHWLLPVIGFTTALLTAFYMFRQYFLTFTGKPRDHHAYDHAHESPFAMTLPLMILGGLAVVSGLGGWFDHVSPPPDRATIIRNYAEYHEKAGHPLTAKVTLDALEKLKAEPAHAEAHAEEGHAAEGENEAGHHGVHHAAHWSAMILSILVAFIGVAVAAISYVERNGVTIIQPAIVARRIRPLYNLLQHKYYFDEMYGFIFLGGTMFLIKFMAAFDGIVIDGIVNAAGFAGKIAAFITGLFDNWVV